MSGDRDERLHSALRDGEVTELARLASRDELERMSLAEDVLSKQHTRRRGPSRLAAASHIIVGYVGLAGFFANAYQNWSSERRWKEEFARSKHNDLQRSFFDTTALAADPTSRDKRLVGYALLKDFMDNDLYRPKATLLLQESLARELRGVSAAGGLDEEHDAAFTAILSGLARTRACNELVDSAGTIDRVVRKKTRAAEERVEILHLYVRWLLARALELCPDWREVREVRRPLQAALIAAPELVNKNKLAPAEANAFLAAILRQHCREEIGTTEVAACKAALDRYQAACAEVRGDPQQAAEESDACAVMRGPTAAAPPAPPIDEGP